MCEKTKEWLSEVVTVCSECLKASCWQGVFMCDEARGADTTTRTRKQLMDLGYENTDYMKTDIELMGG